MVHFLIPAKKVHNLQSSWLSEETFDTLRNMLIFQDVDKKIDTTHMSRVHSLSKKPTAPVG